MDESGLNNQKIDFNKEFLEKLIGKEFQRIEQKIDGNEKLHTLMLDKLEQKVDHNEDSMGKALIIKDVENKEHLAKLNGEYKRIDDITNRNISGDKFDGLAERVNKVEKLLMEKQGSTKVKDENWKLVISVILIILSVIIANFWKS